MWFASWAISEEMFYVALQIIDQQSNNFKDLSLTFRANTLILHSLKSRREKQNNQTKT